MSDAPRRAADDFDAIRANLERIKDDREKCKKRCPHCDQAVSSFHRPDCKLTGTVAAFECEPPTAS